MNPDVSSRTPTPRTRLLIYVFPALYDMVVAMVIFGCSVRAARLGVRPALVAGTLAAWSLVYAVACPLVGRWIRERNAAGWILGSCAAMVTTCWGLAFVPGIAGIYALSVFGALSSALFFPAFQVFMKAVDRGEGKPVTYSTGLYTFAWSLGFAAGPFAAGFLLELGAVGPIPGYVWVYALAGALAITTAVGVRRLRSLADTPAPAADTPAAAAAAGCDYSRMPNLAWVGWIGAGAGILVLSIIRALFPVRAVSPLGLSDSTLGLLFFVLSLAQALTGLALMRSRLWMYRAKAVAAFGAVGAVGCLGFGIASHTTVLALTAVAFGVYSGAFFFYLVFHALTHPRHSAQYVAVNEAVVGVSGVLGPLAGGFLAEARGSRAPYLAGVAVVLLATAWQAWMHRRHPAPA
jgi:MFS family permease